MSNRLNLAAPIAIPDVTWCKVDMAGAVNDTAKSITFMVEFGGENWRHWKKIGILISNTVCTRLTVNLGNLQNPATMLEIFGTEELQVADHPELTNAFQIVMGAYIQAFSGLGPHAGDGNNAALAAMVALGLLPAGTTA